MKVVIQSNATAWGGNEKWLLLVARGLRERNHDVLLSCRRKGAVEQRARAMGLHITHARPGPDADVLSALRFAAMLRREKPDAVLLSAFKRAFWGGWAASRARIPRVVERLGIEQDLPDRWKYHHAFQNYIDALIVNSEAIRERWLSSAPWFPAEEVHVVYNAVEVPTLQSTIRSELKIASSTPLVAAAGTLEQRKGFDLLLHAFAGVPMPDAHLLIAGSGQDETMLRTLAEQLGIAGRTHWLGFRHDLPNVLRGADVFVLSSRREGMANVMLEALAAGCLVIATDVSGVRSALGQRAGRAEAGWIVPVENESALTATLEEVIRLRHRDAAHTYREEARFRVENWFSLPRMISDVERVLAQAAPSQ